MRRALLLAPACLVPACLVPACLIPAAHAATLRPMTTLSAPVVRLSDLFDDAGPNAARVLGPAPRPGERIVVPAAQLAAIARQFGVDWRPGSAGERAVLDQPGRSLPRDILLEALRPALAHAGAGQDLDIELTSFDAPMIPLLARPAASVEQLDYAAGSADFVAALLVGGPGMPPLRFSVAGRLERLIDTLVPLRNLPAGAAVHADDLAPARRRAGLVRGEPVHALAEVAGRVLRRPLAEGQPLLAGDLARPASVSKGARVVMELRVPGMAITAQGVALDSGALGERIAVLNPASQLIVAGEITGPDRIAVQPDAPPRPAAAAEAQVAAR